MFEWSVNVGNLLTIVVLGLGGIGFVYTIRGRVDLLTAQMFALEMETRKLVDILVAQGRHDERLAALDRRLTIQADRIEGLNRELSVLRDQLLHPKQQPARLTGD